MQHFVQGRGRAASPQPAQNGSRLNPARQAIAANAKVSMKKGPTTHRPNQLQAPSSIPSRGFGNAQNSSAAIQHAPSRRHSGQGSKIDPYDTDAESIDTTVNQSIIQVEDSQAKDPQYHQHGEVIDLGGKESEDEEEELEDDEDSEDEEIDIHNYALTQDDVDWLEREGKGNLSRDEAVAYLFQARSEGFRTVEGDSYPTTTDGDPTTWEPQQEPSSTDVDKVSPSLQRDGFNGRQPLAPPPMHSGAYNGGTGQTIHNPNRLFAQSAQLRDQQRVNAHSRQLPVQGALSNAEPGQSSHPPSYSQANRETVPAQAFNTNARSNYQVAFNQAPQIVQRQRPDRVHNMMHPLTPADTPAPTKHPSSARTKAIPIIQHPPNDHAPLQQPPVQDMDSRPHGDYDLEVLDKMSYDQLKNESFDTNPLAPPHPLSEDMLTKPLDARLDHVQKHLAADDQSKFFHALSTNEWEDAGDWFLEQFSSILQRTKQARQKKRKLAQGFEDEIEKRHKHVSKKQHQVEDAMHRMQTQGEGLVPRSPRPSKSPKPRKR
jgi:hypothetical protein